MVSINEYLINKKTKEKIKEIKNLYDLIDEVETNWKGKLYITTQKHHLSNSNKEWFTDVTFSLVNEFDFDPVNDTSMHFTAWPYPDQLNLLQQPSDYKDHFEIYEHGFSKNIKFEPNEFISAEKSKVTGYEIYFKLCIELLDFIYNTLKKYD